MGVNFAASGGEANISQFVISSHYNEPVEVSSSSVELNLYESLLDNTVRAKATLVDTGYRPNRIGSSVIEKDNANVTAAEAVALDITDGYGQRLAYLGDYSLISKEYRNIEESSANMSFTVDFYSKESADNHLLSTRVTKRYEGKIPDSVTKILKEDCLKTPKNVVVDPGFNDYVFLGHVQKPFYLITSLAKKCVPEGGDGTSAGYFFYEVADDGSGSGGYRFRSIDRLFEQEPKRIMIQNNTTDLPPGYTNKILSYYFDSQIDLERTLLMGQFSSQLRKFNPFTKQYEELDWNAAVQFENTLGTEQMKLAGYEASTTSVLTDWRSPGSLPPGSSLQQQLTKAAEFNLPVEDIVRQATSKYNNLFNVKLTVTIPADFGLHAGDLVYCDFPEISSKTNTEVSQRKGGIYMIVDIGHRITKNSSYTSLHLVRDSIFRKPF
jgi:hypothetical protein